MNNHPAELRLKGNGAELNGTGEIRDGLLEAGKVVNAHGVRGNLKLESWCDSPVVLTKLHAVYFKKKNGDIVSLNVKSGFTHKGYAVLSLDGIDDMDEALRYKGAIVYARRDDIPLSPGSFFVRDLIGLPVIDAENGCRYGVTKDYICGAAQDLYEILLDGEDVGQEKKIAYIPAVPQFIDRVEPSVGIYIHMMEGLFD